MPEHERVRKAHLPRPPDFLSERARKEWYKLGRELVKAGLLTDLDRMAFAALVVSYTRWVEATEGLRDSALLIMTANGPAVNPLLKIARDSQAEYIRLLLEFGLTPSSSVRVPGKKEEPEDPFETYMRKSELQRN